MDGFVHIAEGYAKGLGLGDTLGKRTMGYYDQDFLNYYYFMASQFALSDRWFSPVSAKTVPNRIATMTGGTTQGLVKDPSNDDHLGQLTIPTIFEKLDYAGVSWKIYYTKLESNGMPGTSFSYFSYSNRYLYSNPSHAACTGTTQPSSVVGDTSNGFCVDPNHIAPLGQYDTDVRNGTLPSFAYIEPGYEDLTDEHPGLDIIPGQQRVSGIVNKLMNSVSWKDSVFFLAYDEGGPFDHVPPVPGHTNQFTDAALNISTDISSIAVNPDSFLPCRIVSGSFHCDLQSYGGYADPGYVSTDAPAQQGFAAQLGFRVPNIVISPFVRKHYVSHVPMDHTAVIKFVENRFIGSTAHLTARDAAQPDLLDFFDFTHVPWFSPPSPPLPTNASACNPGNLQ
jgi:phospholipase C